MTATGVALSLEGARLQLATISAPLAQPASATPGAPLQNLGYRSEEPGSSSQPDLLPPPLPPSFAALAAALAAVRAAATPALPFAVHVVGADQLRVVCQKARVADVFKLLRAQQSGLGISIRDVKSHVSLVPPAGEELAQACVAGLAAALQHRGWWQMDEERLLGASPLEPSSDGNVQKCASVRLRMHAAPTPEGSKEARKLLLLVLPGGCIECVLWVGGWQVGGKWVASGCCQAGRGTELVVVPPRGAGQNSKLKPMSAALQVNLPESCTHCWMQSKWSSGTLPAVPVPAWRSGAPSWQVRQECT